VKEAVQRNPELNRDDRQKVLNNMHSIILASNRRVDVVLVPQGNSRLACFPSMFRTP
jgi:hypothetical protein